VQELKTLADPLLDLLKLLGHLYEKTLRPCPLLRL
jgi:hypothetical protein